MSEIARRADIASEVLAKHRARVNVMLRERWPTLQIETEVLDSLLIIAESTAELRADRDRLQSQLEGVQGALVDDGTVLAERVDGNYAESVRELTRERDWCSLLARAVNCEKAWWDCEYGIHFKGTIGFSKCKYDANGLPIETPDLRAALTKALEQT